MSLFDPSNIKVFMDISTYCNAGCPQCHRTNKNGLQKVDWLPLIQWSLDDFKKAFPVEELDNVVQFKFCGTWGDPIMNKSIFSIAEYIIKNSKKPMIGIDTNGSIRDEDWWWDLGVLCGNRLKVVFAVDGTTQEMHERYRRFTDLKKVLSNMHMLSQTQAKVYTQTIIFQHNHDVREDIMKLCIDNGSISHEFVTSDRFGGATEDSYIDENGQKHILQKVESLPRGIIAGTNKSVLDEKIKCRWALPRNEVVVNPDGQVVPCCYHANSLYHQRQIQNENMDILRSEIYKEYLKDSKKYNVFYTPLSTILRSTWYTETLPKSFTQNPVHQCVKNCSAKIKKTHQHRERHNV